MEHARRGQPALASTGRYESFLQEGWALGCCFWKEGGSDGKCRAAPRKGFKTAIFIWDGFIKISVVTINHWQSLWQWGHYEGFQKMHLTGHCDLLVPRPHSSQPKKNEYTFRHNYIFFLCIETFKNFISVYKASRFFCLPFKDWRILKWQIVNE